MTLPGSSSFPAEYPEKIKECESIGSAMYHLLEKNIRPRDIMTRSAFENAMVGSLFCAVWPHLTPLQVLTMILGGSTNAVLHLIAVAHSVGINLTIDDFQAVSDRVPFIADLKPSGKYVMEDVYKLGGIPSMAASISSIWMDVIINFLRDRDRDPCVSAQEQLDRRKQFDCHRPHPRREP